MGKVEQDAKIEEFKNAMNSRKYEEAVQIADTLDIKHIRDNNLLCLIADSYELSNDYELAKHVLLYAYENTKAGRHLAYRLCLVSIKNGEYDEAEEYYEDFVEMAPKDTGRYVLQYEMAVARNESKDKLIKILEEYVNIDMEEKWAYELAKLYKENGDTSKCVELCDEMGLWFSEGRYIKKAMELKKSIQPLNITQQQLLDRKEPEEEVEEKPKSEPHVSKSPIASIMEKQPERTPYVEPEAPVAKPEPLFEGGASNIDLSNEQKEYKPSFDITEIKLAEEPQKPAEDMITVKPVDNGPQQMSFFDETESASVEPEVAEEEIPDVQDVEDMLKKLQERGILGADTVNQAVNIIDSDITQIEEELKEEVDSIMSEDEESEEVDSTISEEEPKEDDSVISKVEEPDNRYTREEPEEINPIIPEMANNYSEDDDVAETIISGKDFTQPDMPQLDDVEDSKFHTMQMGNKWESDDERVEDNESIEEEPSREPVEIGKVDDIDPIEIGELDSDPLIESESAEGHTKEIGDVLQKPTEVMPDSDELEKESKKEYQSAKVLDEAVPPTSEEPKEVPVFDLSGEYTSQDNSEPDSEPEVEKEPTLEPELEKEPAKELVETNEGSAKIDMISGDEPENKKEVPEEKTEEPKEENTESPVDLGATKQVDVPTRRELKQKARKEKKKELNTERVKFDVEDSDMAVFGNYLNVEGLEDAVKGVCNDLIKKFTGQAKDTKANVIVMGDEKTGKTTMAIEIIKLVNKKSDRRNRKVAKISADTLNKKSFTKVLAKIQGCDLIVENAQNIHVTTIQEMVKALSANDTDSIVILEAETEPMEELLSSTFSLGQIFDHIIKIKQYNIREWVAYGSDYAKTQGYKLDEVAELALFKAIDDAFGAHKGISKLDVEEIIDKAIARSDRFGKKLFGSKKDEEGLRLLDESDFNINLK